MAKEPARILPPVTALTEPYWNGCREGRLLLQHCDACLNFQFYPRILCSHCGERRLSWRQVTGRGRIASFTVVHEPITPAYPAPLVIVLVDLEEGPRMMSSLIDADPDRVRVGDPVRATFSDWSEERALPVFTIDNQRNLT